AEAELPFAGLQQLLRPVLEHVEGLPRPQRRALGAAFGLAEEVDPDPYLVALAAHQLLSDAAGADSLLLIVDDAHWLDRSSLGVLSFIARRLELESVALIAAVREGQASPLSEVHLPVLDLERLSAPAAAQLLDRDAPDLHPVARARVLAEAAGNPLALVELSRTLASGSDRLSQEPPTLTARLERAFAASLDLVAPQTRLCLLAVALDPRASIEEALACATLLHGGIVNLSDLDPAIAAGIVEVADMQLRFRHPLIRSAVRQGATSVLLLSTYAALAEVVTDPERSLWHRAMAAIGFDEGLAAELDTHAERAMRRGAATVAASALERAAALSSDSREKGERLLRAAELAYELGSADAVRRLIAEANSLELGALGEARLAWLRQMTSGDVWVEAGAAKTFVTIARQMSAAGDADMAVRSLVPVAHRAWWTRPAERTRRYLVDAAENVGVADDDPRLLAVIALADPERTGPSVLRRVSLKRLARIDDPADAFYLGIAAEKAGDFARARRFLSRAVERLREEGRLGLLAQALVHYAWTSTHAGDFRAGEAAGVEAAGLAGDSRQLEFGLIGELAAMLARALRGDPGVEQMITAPEEVLVAMNGGPLLAPAHMARGAAALGEGRYEDAFGHLWPVFDPTERSFHRFMRWPAVLDLAEAGARSGRSDQVAEAFVELEAIARQSEPPILRAGLSCARPLLADDEHAESLFVAALEHDLTDNPFLRARTLFSFGGWLRRRRRSAESRVPLRQSVHVFDLLGAARWSGHARQELRATGEKIGRRTPDARDRLTAQELQIAELAARGLSNREIGERLFLSHRTIGSHLYRIFPKLEVGSRGQLRDALAAAGPRDEQSDDSSEIEAHARRSPLRITN
ncbi:MAG TPA: LuxR C-terminal-related transcriptional regulator, partial [Solirubrobacteraceae bacterium]|nr:LuxR C-terminal-related transcriptional regulator [Solirubrobacteraceae bacterium]